MVDLVATPSGEFSNSYTTVEEADQYHAERLHTDTWMELDEETKKRGLIWATRRLDAVHDWYGFQYNRRQHLQWPRFFVYDESSYLYAPNELPQEIIWATAEYANYLVEENRPRTKPEPDYQGFGSLSVGNLNLTVNKYDRAREVPPEVLAFTRYLGRYNHGSATRVVRLER